jgi:Pyruvate/2-oxoacid:ferredoxin oxidoreductase delta subunit
MDPMWWHRPRPQRTRSASRLRYSLVQVKEGDAEESNAGRSSVDERSVGKRSSNTGSFYEFSRHEWILHGLLQENSTEESSASILRRTSSLPNIPASQSDIANPVSIPHTDSHLCSICRGIFYYCKDPDDAVLTHRIVDFFNGASKGCKFCQVVCSKLDAEEDGAFLCAAREPANLGHARRCELQYWSNNTLSLMWRLIEIVAQTTLLFIEMAPNPDTRMLARVSLTSRMPAERSCTSSKRSLGLASCWLKNCTELHQSCRDSTFQTGGLPTRLLSICNEGLLLCRGSEIPPSTPYITLSHRWGETNRNHLTTALFEDKPTIWTRDELLPTFQDTILVAERLGIRYLWIDSLCIIQNSEADRARECGRMGEVYGSSHCNIAATAAMDGTQGLFRDHEFGGPSPCQISPRWDQIRKKAILDKNVSRSYRFYDIHEGKNQINRSPLGERAWVVQERLLAPRILHFAERQLYWECREQYALEKHPLDVPQEEVKYSFVKQSLDPCKLLQEGRVESCYAAWHQYVQLYSPCALTRPEDKLVAFAGIARRVGELLKACGTTDEYLAGLWRHTLLSDLLWSRIETFRSRSRYTGPYRAPSWSWALNDGGVEHNAKAIVEEDVIHAEIVNAYTTASIDPFGAVTAGAIDIRAPLLRVPLEAGKKKPVASTKRVTTMVIRHIPPLTSSSTFVWMSPSIISVRPCKASIFTLCC